MAKFKQFYSKGINQDSSENNYPKGAYFNLENGRLISDEDLSSGDINTFRGNELINHNNLTDVTFPTQTQLINGYNLYMSIELIEDVTNGITTNAEAIAKFTSYSSWDSHAIIGSCKINNDLIVFDRLYSGTTYTDQVAIWRFREIDRFSGRTTLNIGDDYYRLELIYVVEDIEYSNSEQIKIDAIGYYESSRIQNIYWIDGIYPMKRLNIVELNVLYKSIDMLDIIPKANNSPMQLVDIESNGSLGAGQIQYAYSYIIPNGQKSFFSLPSPLIHLTDSPEQISNAGRSYKGVDQYDTDIIDNEEVTTTTIKNSNKSVTVAIEDVDNRYDYIEIVSLYYSSLNEDPVIKIIYRGKVTSGSFSITDFGTSNLGTYTLSEYRLFNIDFVPKTIATKDNILFAGNITEEFYNTDEWNDFDARAFRYDSSGNCRLYDEVGSNSSHSKNNDNQYRISGTSYSTTGYYENNILVDTIDISNYQDLNAINRFNNIELTPNQRFIPYSTGTPEYQYCFQSNGTTVGGSGPNISFKFITKELGIYNKDYTYLSGADSSTSDNYIITSGNNKDELDIGPDSYSSPYNDAYYKQYKRNEIYRYGIVVYSLKGTPSEPKWICDIRTPVNGKHGLTNSTSTNSSYEIVEHSSSISGTTDTVESIANALGIDFSISIPTNLKNEISGYSIVRCNRDENRTNLGQGLISQIRYYDTAGESTIYDDGGSPLGYDQNGVNMNGHWLTTGVVNRNTASTAPWGYDSYEHFEVMIPEASFNNNLQGYNSSYIQPLGGVVSDEFTNTFLKYKIEGIFGVPETREYYPGSTASGNATLSYSGSWASYSENRISPQLFHGFSNWISTPDGAGVGFYDVQKATADVEYSSLMSPGSTEVTTDGLIGWSTSHGGGSRNYQAQSMYFKIPNNTVSETTSNPITRIPDAISAVENAVHWVVVDYLRFSIPYGGFTNDARELSTYQYSDNYVSIDEHVDSQYLSNYSLNRESASIGNKVGKSVYGGDTFICFYQHVRGTTPDEHFDTDGFPATVHTNVATFPCESTINLNLRHDDYIPTYTDEFNINIYKEKRPAPGVSWLTDNFLQFKDLFLYNTVFSKQNNAYIIQSVANNNNLGRTFTSKVISSKKKFIGEYIDSWSMFGANEYIDLDTTSGSVTKLINYKDALYALQTNAISKLAVNEKSTVQDDGGQSIVLGTGGVLPYSTFITKTSGTKYKWSVISTPDTIYYYDHISNSINYLSDKNGGVSDVKGLFSYFSEFDTGKLNSIDSVYNHKYREAHFTFDFSDDDFSVESTGFNLILNDKTKSFSSINKYLDEVSGNTLIPYMHLPFNNKIFTPIRYSAYVSSGELYAEDLGQQNVFYDNYTPLKLILLLNSFGDNVTVLDNIEFNSTVNNVDEVGIIDSIVQDETITSIRLYNSYQDTGTINLVSDRLRGRSIIRREVRKWRYNYFRDTLDPRGRNPRMQDSFFFMEIGFDSRLHTGAIASNNPRKLKLGNIDMNFRDINTTYL